MNKKTFKKVAVVTLSTMLLLGAVLVTHIYLVTRPKAPDAHTIAMARIDLKQAISQQEADQITAWLYSQQGIDHVLCNPQSAIVVFTFYPIKASGNDIVNNFRSNFNFKNAIRYMPTEDELKSGCPVAATSVTYKVYNYISHIF